MSYITQFAVGTAGGVLLTLTGDVGGSIGAVAGNIDLLGGNVLTTTGTPGTITIDLDNGTDGQLLIGGGSDPAWADLASAGGTITITTGANTLDIDVDITALSVATTFDTDAGSATPALNTITIAGGTNINTAGAAATVTVNLDDAITVATSVSTPLYTVAAGNVVINMTDDAGANLVSFTNDSDAQVASIDSLGAAEFTDLDVDNININGDTIFNDTNDLVLRLSEDAGANAVSVHNGSDAEVASIDSLGAADFTELDVDNININGNSIISTDTNGDITLTPDGTGNVNISYLTQYTLPITSASGAISDLADGLGSNGQVLTSNGAGAEPTWEDASGGGGITWNEETGTSATMSVDNGYIANNAALVTLTLPDTAALGSVVRVAGKGAGGWKIAQNAGETIHFGTSDTTTGVGGSLASTEQYDAVELVCITADTDWVVISSIGNITVV